MSLLKLPARMDAGSHADVSRVCERLASDAALDVLDASETIFVGALEAAMLACAAAARVTPVQRVLEPRAWAARKFAGETLLWERIKAPLSVGEVQHSDDTLALRQLRALDPVFTSALAELLATHVTGVTQDVSHLVQLCLNETLQNVFEHARSDVGCFVLARWHKKLGNLRIAVVDRGRGIPEALRDVPSNRGRSDDELVRDAVMRLGTTSRANGVGGLGLKNIRELVVAREGRLVVATGTVFFSANARGAGARRGPHWHGTAVEMDFRPSAIVADSGEELLF
jgi:anti-sigma regulatory factor (Ser/Thr protein kinase)